MDKQRIVNDLMAFLNTDPEPAWSAKDGCMYLGDAEEGCKRPTCFIGALLSNPEGANGKGSVGYNPVAYKQLAAKYGGPAEFLDADWQVLQFLREIQVLHDAGAGFGYNIRDESLHKLAKRTWLDNAKKKLTLLALKNNLTPPA